jgi:hypothetical protein
MAGTQQLSSAIVPLECFIYQPQLCSLPFSISHNWCFTVWFPFNFHVSSALWPWKILLQCCQTGSVSESLSFLFNANEGSWRRLIKMPKKPHVTFMSPVSCKEDMTLPFCLIWSLVRPWWWWTPCHTPKQHISLCAMLHVYWTHWHLGLWNEVQTKLSVCPECTFQLLTVSLDIGSCVNLDFSPFTFGLSDTLHRRVVVKSGMWVSFRAVMSRKPLNSLS